MTRDEAISELQRGLGFRSDLGSQLGRALGLAQSRLELGTDLPWFLREEDFTFVVSAGTATQSLPSNFLREVEDDEGMRILPSGATQTIPLQKMGYTEGERAYGLGSGGPQAYTLRGTSWRFWPAPDVDTTFLLSYYKKDTVLSGEGTNLWLTHAPFLLIGKVGVDFAQDLRNREAAQKFAALEAEARRNLTIEEGMRGVSNRTIILGRKS